MDAIPPGLHRSSPAEIHARLSAERTGAPHLVFRDAGGTQRIVPLTGDRSPLTVGRQASSGIALTWDAEVSRAHAAVECIGDVWTVVDDGRSRNGSFVNGERVHGRRALRHGDVLTVGHTALAFVAPLTGGDGSTIVGLRGAAPPLSAAQRRVLVALCRPLSGARFAIPPSNRELAAELSLSIETVKFHLHALFELFGIERLPQHHKRAALARLALERGVVGPRDVLRPS